MHSYREPPPKPVVHTLTVYLAGTEEDEGPLFQFTTTSALPAPAVGEVLDRDAWPEPCFYPEQWGQPLLVVSRDTCLHEADDGMAAECILTVDWGPDAEPPAVAEAERRAERQRCRAEFFATVAGELVPSVAGTALDKCAAAIVSRLSAEPPRGIGEEAVSACQEAAGIVKADGHLLYETVVRELYGLADQAIRDLSITDRVVVWLHTAPEELDPSADMWGRDDLRQFDPLTACRGALDEAQERVVSRVLGKLCDVNLSAGA